MSLPSVSVVIPVWNGRETLDACLGSVGALVYPEIEIVVVDNASTDGGLELAEARGLGERIVRSSRNLGFAGGCNLGLERARGEILVLLNQDAVVERDWLRPLVDALEAPGAGVAGSLCLYPDGATIQSAGGSLVWPLGLAFSVGQHEPDGSGRRETEDLDFVSGCGMAFRRDLLEAIGPLDEAFWPGYYEDVDFCLRARRAGRTVRMVPEARLRHLESGAFRRWRSIWRFHHRSRLHCVLKNLSGTEIIGGFLPAERLTLPALVATVDGCDLSRAYAETVRRSLPRLAQAGHITSTERDEIAAALLDLARTAAEAPAPAAPDEPPALLATRRHLASALRHLRSSLERGEPTGDGDGRAESVDWLHLAIESRESELASVQEVLAARTRDLEAAARHAKSLERQAEALRETIASREGEIEAAKVEISNRDDLLAERDGHVDSLTETLAARTAEIEAAGERIESLSGVLRARETQIADLEDELGRHRDSLEAAHRSIRELQARIALLESGPLGRVQAWRTRRRDDS